MPKQSLSNVDSTECLSYAFIYSRLRPQLGCVNTANGSPSQAKGSP